MTAFTIAGGGEPLPADTRAAVASADAVLLGAGPRVFEPVHGSAPDLAGRGIADPIGAIASAALLLRYGLQLPEAADAVEAAIRAALDAGARTRDMAADGAPALGTREMGERIVELVLDKSLEAPLNIPHSAFPIPHSGEGL